MALEGSRYVEWKALDASFVLLLAWGLTLLPLYKEGSPAIFQESQAKRALLPLEQQG